MLTLESEQSPVLLHGDYEYLTEGYYACEEAEESDRDLLPTCADTLDAYVVPIAMERARLAGLAIPEWSLTNQDFHAPAVLYGVNPFARSHEVVREESQTKEAAAKISRNGKFVICCQSLPPDAELVSFEMILGRSVDDRFSAWAEDIYQVFRLPMAMVRLIRSDRAMWLSAIERLPLKELSAEGKDLLAGQMKEERQNG